LTTLAQRREAAIRAMRDHKISQRRVCDLVGVDPKTVRRERPPDHAGIRRKMHEIAEKRRRFGYPPPLTVCLQTVRGQRMPIPNRPNVRWSLDFVSDTFGTSRKFRILAVNDDCTRENLGLVADTSLSGARVARELTAMIRIYGKPDCIVSDNGTEFTSTAILKCPYGD
jgi:putative transposase